MKITTLIVACLLACLSATAQENSYQRPPKVIEEMALAPLTPTVDFNSDYSQMMQLHGFSYTPLSELAQPELRLAGARINPDTYSVSRRPGYNKIVIVNLKNNAEMTIQGLPEESIIWSADWYPSGDRILIANKEKDGIYLYSASLANGKATRLSNRRMNATLSDNVFWLNNTDFLFKAVPASNQGAPTKSQVPTGPVVQENLGKSVPARTYQDLLKNGHDEALFEYYFTSQIVKITANGEQEIGKPGIYSQISLSPDKSLMLTNTIEKPYSYTVPYRSFPTNTQVIDLDGKLVK